MKTFWPPAENSSDTTEDLPLPRNMSPKMASDPRPKMADNDNEAGQFYQNVLGNRPPPPRFDGFAQTSQVSGLNSSQFDFYLPKKKVALVFFYNVTDQMSIISLREFVKAASSRDKAGQFYAGVNCADEPELCAREFAFSMPTYKLYVGGKPVVRVDATHVEFFDANNMKKFVEHADKLNLPDPKKGNEEKNFVDAIWSLSHSIPSFQGDACLFSAFKS